MNEIWKDVVGWEGLYEVSSQGRVRSFDREVRCGYGRTRIVSGRILQGWLQNGYPMVGLCRAGEPNQRIFVHRLVCEAFHGPPPSDAHEVAHNDGCPSNSSAVNIRWATHRENEADKRLHGTAPIGGNHGGAISHHKAGLIKAAEGSRRQIALAFGVSESVVQAIRTGRHWTDAYPEAA